MRLSTAINLQSRLYTRMLDEISAARIYGSTSSAMHQRILDSRPANTPLWLKHYLDGARRAMVDSLYRYDLVFRFVLPDGSLLDTDHFPDGWDHARVCRENLPSGHFWKVNNKPFFVSQDGEV